MTVQETPMGLIPQTQDRTLITPEMRAQALDTCSSSLAQLRWEAVRNPTFTSKERVNAGELDPMPAGERGVQTAFSIAIARQIEEDAATLAKTNRDSDSSMSQSAFKAREKMEESLVQTISSSLSGEEIYIAYLAATEVINQASQAGIKPLELKTQTNRKFEELKNQAPPATDDGRNRIF